MTEKGNKIIPDNIFDCTKERVQDFFVVENKLNHFKNLVNDLFINGKASENENQHIDFLKQFIYIYNNLVIKGTQIVSVYSGNDLIFINPVFCNIKGLNQDEIYTRLESGENMLHISYEGLNETILKARKYIAKILSNKIIGYKNVEFKMPIQNKNGEQEIIPVLWNTIKLSNGITLRIGFKSFGKEEFFKEELIENIDLDKTLTFSKKVDSVINNMNISSFDKDDSFKNIRLMSLIVDFYIHFGSMPVSIYKASEPILLNEAFINLTGYSEKELIDHYRQFGSITRLIYKGKDYLEVINYLEKLKKSGFTGDGYENVDFTISSKPDEMGNYRRITIGWNTFIVGDLTVRSGIVKSIEEVNINTYTG
ncbi:MAG: hypothetical protein PHZ26_03205 [Candidatus Gracilibacteria bacterium]|nr:hypothetical protein [Candidatus Gracilibacteria bacterium]MDD2908735.1 hypothetical protein [Candidatus Gracilibacteria bacterium]